MITPKSLNINSFYDSNFCDQRSLLLLDWVEATKPNNILFKVCYFGDIPFIYQSSGELIYFLLRSVKIEE